MYRLIINLLIGLVLMVLASPVYANGVSAACAGLERPNIDCACVDKRMNGFIAATNSVALKKLFVERYFYAVGLENSIDEATSQFMADINAVVAAQMAFDQFGGLPENIEDFERGCVIQTADRFQFSPPSPNTPAAAYLEANIKSVGENQRRNSVCLVNKMSSYLTDAELQAYQLSFSHYEGDHNNDDVASRAKVMRVSKTKYQQLEQSARNKLKKRIELDESYCSAMTYADDFSVERINAERIEEAGRFDTRATSAALVSTSEQGDLARAEQIMQSTCQQQGNSDQFCQCVMQDFDQKVVQRSPRPSVTLAWVVMRNGSNMNSNEVMQIMQNTNPQDQQAATQMFMSTLDVGESCVEDQAEEISLEGNPRDRMMKVCLADMQDQEICSCVVDKMQSRLSEDDFEFVVDLRQAESQGADDPLAVVAQDRGLTRQQAEQALGSNRALIGGMMNMDLMSCVGGLPDMNQFPQAPTQ